MSKDDETTVDLHGFPVWEATELATTSIQKAWQQGKTHITLIHGAPDVRHWSQAFVLGRAGIKWQLRGHLARGEWNQYAFNRRSKQHCIGDGAMTLALRQNPSDSKIGA